MDLVEDIGVAVTGEVEEGTSRVARDVGVRAVGDGLFEFVAQGHSTHQNNFVNFARGREQLATHMVAPTAPAPSPIAIAWPKETLG